MGQAHGAKQNGVRRFADLERVLRQGHAAVQVVLCASLLIGQVESHTNARLQSAQKLLRSVHDFDANAIAWQNGNVISRFHSSMG